MKTLCLILLSIFLMNCTTVKNVVNNDDTLFVLFEKTKMTEKNTIKMARNKGKNIYYKYDYNYYFDIQKENPFFYLHYADFFNYKDLSENINKSIILYINESFLENNKSKIITKKDMDRLGAKETYNMLSKSRTIFLIDKEEIKGGEILLRQVKLQISIYDDDLD